MRKVFMGEPRAHIRRGMRGAKEGAQELLTPFTGPAAQRAFNTYGAEAEGVQDALLKLIGGKEVELGGLREKISRMAASDAALNALKGVPIAGAAYGLTTIPDMASHIFGGAEDPESFAHTPMDLLGMGAGAAGAAYGMNRGVGRVGGTTRAGASLGAAAALGAGVGKLGMDALQGLVGM